MLLINRVFSSVGIARRLIASPAVPITVDSENAPARSPAAVPMSYPRSFAATKALTRHVTQRTTASATWDTAAFFRARTHWGPTLYPVANRNGATNTG